jgi:hypothetical protein
VRWCVVLVAVVGIVLDAAGAIGALEEPALGFNTTAVGIAALSRGEFVQLTEFVPGGPMDEAGLRVGDRVRVVRGDLGELTGASENATAPVHFARADGRSGGLACAYPAGDDEFAPDEAAALAALASRIAIARDDLLAQSLHAQTVRLAAERDGLTERLVALERENALLTRLAGRS